MLELNIAGLDTRIISARDGSGLHPNSVVVLLHGYGVAGDDLVYLANELDLPSNTALVFPQGPIELSAVPGFGNAARGWWPTDETQLRLAMFTGQTTLVSRVAGMGRQEVRPVLTAFMDELQARVGVGPSQIVIGGFSQGAVLCVDWALHDSRPWAGILCLSGALVDSDDWKSCLATRGALRVLIGHGVIDPVLPIALARKLSSLLVQFGWEVEFVTFNGSHAIPTEVSSAVSRAIRCWLAETPADDCSANGSCVTT